MTRPKPVETKRRDRTRTRARLVASAREVFAAKGFAGARIDDVAEAAGVSKALVFHHFGTKEAVYEAALEAEVLALRRHQRDLDLRDLEPREAVRRLVFATFDYFYEHPAIIAFLNAENQLGGRHMRRSAASIAAYDPLLASIALILERGVAAGAFRPGVDPLELYLSIAGMSYHYVANRHTLGAVFQRDLSSPDEVARRRQQIAAFTLQALAAAPPAPGLGADERDRAC